MSNDSDGAYRCPKCGATAALLMPQPVLHQAHVALKCLECAHVLRMPRHELEAAAFWFDSTSSLE
jgi:DNA-directed RNA polymerase subunit RPC12/RpoP